MAAIRSTTKNTAPMSVPPQDGPMCMVRDEKCSEDPNDIAAEQRYVEKQRIKEIRAEADACHARIDDFVEETCGEGKSNRLPNGQVAKSPEECREKRHNGSLSSSKNVSASATGGWEGPGPQGSVSISGSISQTTEGFPSSHAGCEHKAEQQVIHGRITGTRM